MKRGKRHGLNAISKQNARERGGGRGDTGKTSTTRPSPYNMLVGREVQGTAGMHRRGTLFRLGAKVGGSREVFLGGAKIDLIPYVFFHSKIHILKGLNGA